jgi:hypothetical protein
MTFSCKSYCYCAYGLCCTHFKKYDFSTKINSFCVNTSLYSGYIKKFQTKIVEENIVYKAVFYV